MTRDELIEKARASGFCDHSHAIADFCLPLLAEAREEALEGAATYVQRSAADLLPCLERTNLSHRIRALARETNKPEERQTGRDRERASDASERNATGERSAPPALSDADVLERAAEILERDPEPKLWSLTTQSLRRASAHLRARSAPPAPPNPRNDPPASSTEDPEFTAALRKVEERYGPMLQCLTDKPAPDVFERVARECRDGKGTK